MPRIESAAPEIAAGRVMRGDRVLTGRGELLRQIERECEKDGVPCRRLTPTRKASP